MSGKIMLENLRPSWIIFSSGFTVSSLTRRLKRLGDLLLSVIGLLLAVPLLAAIALLIRLDSRGPVFFTQERLGENKKTFVLFKFRSMYVDAEQATGPVFAQTDDARVTRLGRLLRATRLDELPQLLNVLRGDMSFVGPRPERPFFVEQFEKEIPYYSQRLCVKPGITGWAQVNYPYGATREDAAEKLRLDLYYIKHLSLPFDLLILLKTVKIALLGQGAR
jgi:exopolysaccharide biosynthesis polyprenyl glycosylphosphotransferase